MVPRVGEWWTKAGLVLLGLRPGEFRGRLYEKYHNGANAKLGTKGIFMEDKKINMAC